MTEKTLEQFLCDFFKKDDFVEVNAIWLQTKIMDAIKNERLAAAQLKDYRITIDRLKMKVDYMNNEKLRDELDSDVRYRINERV